MKLSENSPGEGESPERPRGVNLASFFDFGRRLLVSAGIISAKENFVEDKPSCVFLNERALGTTPFYYFYLTNAFSHTTYFCVYASTDMDANRLALQYFDGLFVAGKVFTDRIYPIDETPAKHMRVAKADGRWR